ncbi:hypothetical protein [Nonlabens xiamenensis]|uniref:hypothetical protein n=1 Tax=Nonlabens xiamenensis TaxID=2341043 RepID=UPI000F60EE07|nr:hypothetical protein [Nonlabens xiamenensis]
MIQFFYVHVPTNQKLESFTEELIQPLIEQDLIQRADVTFKKIIDIKNRCREVVTINAYIDHTVVHCEVASLTFKKSAVKVTDLIRNKICGEVQSTLMSA